MSIVAWNWLLLMSPVWASVGVDHWRVIDQPAAAGIGCQTPPWRFELPRLSFEAQCKVEKLTYAAVCLLVARKDMCSLKVLAMTHLPGSQFATTTLVMILPPKEAVRYCRSLTTGSWTWTHAFYQLHRLPKAEVMAYIREVMSSGDATDRCHCYLVCQFAGWTDLLDFAERDVNDDSVVFRVNGDIGKPTIADYAKDYAEFCRKMKSRSANNW